MERIGASLVVAFACGLASGCGGADIDVRGALPASAQTLRSPPAGVYQRAGCWDAAADVARRAIAISSSLSDAWLRLGTTYSTNRCNLNPGRALEALDALQRFVVLAGGDPSYGPLVQRVTRRCGARARRRRRPRNREVICIPGTIQGLESACHPTFEFTRRGYPSTSDSSISCALPSGIVERHPNSTPRLP